MCEIRSTCLRNTGFSGCAAKIWNALPGHGGFSEKRVLYSNTVLQCVIENRAAQGRLRKIRMFQDDLDVPSENGTIRMLKDYSDIHAKKGPDKDTYSKTEGSYAQADCRHFKKAFPERQVLGNGDIEIEDQNYQYAYH